MLKHYLFASSFAAIMLTALWGVGCAEGSCTTHGDMSAVSLTMPSFYAEADFPTFELSNPTDKTVIQPDQESGESTVSPAAPGEAKAPESGESIGTGTMPASDPGNYFPHFGTTRPLDDMLGIHNGPEYMGPVREDETH